MSPKVPIEARLVGAVWGHLVGDALGVPYEFSAPGTVSEVRWGAVGTHGQPPGTWSDDGGLMLALLDSLLSTGFDLEDQGRRALAWYDSSAYMPGPVFDVGVTTMRALDRLRAGTPAIQTGGAAEVDNGNGSLMRVLPVAIAEPEVATRVLVQKATMASCVTHRHPRAQVTCAVYCVVAARLLAGEQDSALLLQSAFNDVGSVVDAELLAELRNLKDYQLRTGGGYVLDCFWSAWEAFESSSSYREAVEKAIGLGNDTDTTACIVGALAGRRWGVDSIPVEWLTGMRGRAIVQPLVDRLLERWKVAG